jgi:hypothetical protein
MLSFSGSLKVFVALEACDMRKGFNGLYSAVTERLGEDPKGGTGGSIEMPSIVDRTRNMSYLRLLRFVGICSRATRICR